MAEVAAAPIEIEQCLLGAVLRSAALFVAFGLRPEDFSEPTHAAAVEAMLELVDEGEVINPPAVARRILDRHAEIVEVVPGVTVGAYLRIVTVEAYRKAVPVTDLLLMVRDLRGSL